MPFPYDKYPWLNFQELNLAYFIKHFREIFQQWDEMLEDMYAWKDETDADLAEWKTTVESGISSWETGLQQSMEDWKDQTEADISTWEAATLAALDAWKTATTAVFEQIRTEAAASATAAAGSASSAQTALAGAQAAQAAAEAAAASVSGSADEIVQLRTDLDDNLLDYIATVNPDNWFNRPGFSAGILGVDGTVTASENRVYTNYDIPVVPGNVYIFVRADNWTALDTYKIAAYDADHRAIPAKGRNNSSASGYTVPEGISFIRVTIALSAYNYTTIKQYLSIAGMPSVYTPYFDPYQVFTRDFLTPETSAEIESLGQRLTSAETAITGLNTRADSIETSVAAVNDRIDDLAPSDLQYPHACSMPAGRTLRMSVGIPESWYFSNALTPNGYINISAASMSKRYNNRIEFPNISPESHPNNGFSWYYYDEFLTLLSQENGTAGAGRPRYVAAEALADCTLLAIGDSTIAGGQVVNAARTHFQNEGHTLTLIGTRGTAPNLNEGRSGWSAADYFTNRSADGQVNPFWNPTSETFDFSYYMQQTGFNAPDYVVIQLGINDLYNASSAVIPETWERIAAMCTSILTYRAATRIILDLPTPPNPDQSNHSVWLPAYKSRVVRYCETAIRGTVSTFGDSQVRTSYAHLILDPDTDIPGNNVHPSAAGYTKIGLEIVNQINCWMAGI